MKKNILIIFLLLGLLLPTSVFAAKNSGDHIPRLYDLPTEGVTYFLEYPNDVEVVLENYEDNMDERLELIYEGTSNENGEVVVENLPTNSRLRIIEDISSNYTTNAREIDLDMSKGNTVTFTNYKGIVNPATGQTLIRFIAVLLICFSVTVLLIIQRKKALQAILIILSVVLISQVKAVESNLVINVKDNKGNKMSGVDVKVYAKPLNIEATPAIKLSSGEGTFFDGTKLMYLRIPEEGFNDNLTGYLKYNCDDSNSDICYAYFNSQDAYRLGYGNNMYINAISNYQNGDTVEISWSRDETIDKLYTIYPNGTYFNFYNKKLAKIVYTENNSFLDMFNFLSIRANNYLISQNKYLTDSADKYYIGLDDNKECTNYQYGFINGLINGSSNNYYACWSEQPDGIYVNNELFIGNISNKYIYQNAVFNSKELFIEMYNDKSHNPLRFYSITTSPIIGYNASNVESIIIRDGGNVYLSLSGEDLHIDKCNDKDYCNYSIRNVDKRSLLSEYLLNLSREISPDWETRNRRWTSIY